MPSYPDSYRGAPLPAADLDRRRQLVLDRLTEAFAGDLVPMEDYEARVSRAQNAITGEELDSALAGLPTDAAPGGSARAAPAFGSAGPSRTGLPNRLDSSIAGTSGIACVMGDRNLVGDWLSGDQVSSFTMMGSTKLDLRDTALPPNRLKIDVFVLMGEIQIIVPRGLPVRMNAFPFMGEAHTDRDVSRRIEPGKPYVEVNGFALMGSMKVIAAD